MCNYLTKMFNNSSQNDNWKPCDNLLTRYKENNYAVIILNCTINLSPNILINLWNQAKIRITVDGGTKRWLTWLEANHMEQIVAPDLITGDMDSLSKEILNYFLKNSNCEIVKTPDQNETDFTKTLRQLERHCRAKNKEIDIVYIIGDTSGRFDQIMANINTLFKARQILPNIKLYQVAADSITWLLEKGKHTIHIPTVLRQQKGWCALIPIGEASFVTTTGLKWNLVNQKLEFGELVSTSNTYDGSPTVTVQTNNPVIWSMDIKSVFEIL